MTSEPSLGPWRYPLPWTAKPDKRAVFPNDWDVSLSDGRFVSVSVTEQEAKLIAAPETAALLGELVEAVGALARFLVAVGCHESFIDEACGQFTPILAKIREREVGE